MAGERWMAGESLEAIAKDLGVKTSTLNRQITKRGFTRQLKQERGGRVSKPRSRTNEEVSRLRAAYEASQARVEQLQAENQRLEGERQEIRGVIRRSYGAMSRLFHPDMGGSVDRQTVVNLCFEDLLNRFDR
jgi:predicted nuclease with TOPRIM domain